MKMGKTNNSTVPAFGMKDRLGYMFGDFGNDFTFILSSMFMMKFYTDVMGLSAGVVGMLMMAARFVDAFTDVTMGQIVDRSKPTKDGKFRPWIKRMCGPVAIASFLIYQSGLADMPYGVKVAYMVVTYLLWGSIFYTSINIPYGSMASAISPDPTDRASLSTWRSVGASLASLVIGTGTPLVAYVTVDGNPVLSGSRMTIIAGVFSVLAVICYLLCYNLVRERVPVPANNQKLDIVALGKSLITNRALLGIIAAALLLLLAMLGMQGMSAYVFPNVYRSTQAQSVVALLSNVATIAICAPLASKLASKLGKKELATVSCLFGAASYVVCLILHPENVWVYVIFYVMSFVGLGFFNTIIWAMITDVIDDAEVKNGIREDGTIYAVYSFARKLGQAFSSGMVGGLLSLAGYTAATAFEPAVTESILRISCIVPIVGLTAVALALIFIYPLSKKRVEENCAELARRREEK
jgi:GPH family glycoside/pentoside/hexuronide:cation symporter